MVIVMRSHNVPALRLEGFDGEWEAQRAREIFIETDDRGYPDLPVLSATQTRGMVPRSMMDSSSSTTERMKWGTSEFV